MRYDSNARIVEGHGSVEMADNQGDFVSMQAIYDIMPKYMERGGVLMDTHTNRHIGKIIDWAPDEKNGKPAIWLKAQLFDDFSTDDAVWEAIKKGHYTGFSFGGRSLDKQMKCTQMGCRNHINKIEMWEWSLVAKPANRGATYTNYNEMAKGDKELTKKAMMPELDGEGNVIYRQVEIAVGEDMLAKSDDLDIEKAANPKMGFHGEHTKRKTTDSMSNIDDDLHPSKPRSRVDTELDAKFGDNLDAYREARHGNPNINGRHESWGRKEYEDVGPNTKMPDNYGKKNLDKASDDSKAALDDAPLPNGGADGECECKRGKNMPEDINKEDVPMTPPSEDESSPMNQILNRLDAIDSRLDSLEGTGTEEHEAPMPEAELTPDPTGFDEEKSDDEDCDSEEKSEDEEKSDDMEKAANPKMGHHGMKRDIDPTADGVVDKVVSHSQTTKNTNKRNDIGEANEANARGTQKYMGEHHEGLVEGKADKLYQRLADREKSDDNISKSEQENKAMTGEDIQKSDDERLALAVQDELKKMGFVESPKPGVSGELPYGAEKITVADELMKSAETPTQNGFDIHSMLGNVGWQEVDHKFRRD